MQAFIVTMIIVILYYYFVFFFINTVVALPIKEAIVESVLKSVPTRYEDSDSKSKSTITTL